MKENTSEFRHIHQNFKWRGSLLNVTSLKELANLYLKEGEPYEEEIGKFFLEWLDDKNYVEVHTSGSTGTPKIIQVRKEWMFNSANATGKFFELPPKTTALLCLPATYIAGKLMLVRAMVLGWHIDSVPPRSNPLDQVYKRFDFCAMTPFQLDNSLGRLHLISKLIVGGGAISLPLKALVQDLSTKVYETYGMTETVTHIAARRVNSAKSKKGEIPFRALPDVSLSVDERNCLVIRAPGVADEPVITNDVVELETFKKFYWRGRIDHVINTGGIKIFPEQVERKLENTILHRFFITSLPDDALGEKIILFVEAPFSEESLEELTQQIKEIDELTKFERPKKIYFVEKFEETHTGKIHRIHTLKARLH